MTIMRVTRNIAIETFVTEIEITACTLGKWHGLITIRKNEHAIYHLGTNTLNFISHNKVKTEKLANEINLVKHNWLRKIYFGLLFQRESWNLLCWWLSQHFCLLFLSFIFKQAFSKYLFGSALNIPVSILWR